MHFPSVPHMPCSFFSHTPASEAWQIAGVYCIRTHSRHLVWARSGGCIISGIGHVVFGAQNRAASNPTMCMVCTRLDAVSRNVAALQNE